MLGATPISKEHLAPMSLYIWVPIKYLIFQVPMGAQKTQTAYGKHYLSWFFVTYGCEKTVIETAYIPTTLIFYTFLYKTSTHSSRVTRGCKKHPLY